MNGHWWLVPLMVCGLACASKRSRVAEAPCPEVSAFDFAPPNFYFDRGGEAALAIPMDIRRVEVRYEAKADQSVVNATAFMTFVVDQVGRPFFQFRQEPKFASLDGRTDTNLVWVQPNPPGGRTDPEVVVIDTEEPLVPRATPYTLEVRYKVSASVSDAHQHGIELAFVMSDTSSCNTDCNNNDVFFADTYFPSNFEFDTFTLDLALEVLDDNQGRNYHVFSNAQWVHHPDESRHWELRYPPWYNTASFYLHLTAHTEYKGVIAAQNDPSTDDYIPALDIHISKRLIDDRPKIDEIAASLTQKIRALSKRLGPMPVRRLVVDLGPRSEPEAYVPRRSDAERELASVWAAQAYYSEHAFNLASQGEPGLEYAGAIWLQDGSSATTMRHELAHQWFARSARPPTAADGWIDEALAELLETEPPGSGPTTCGRFGAVERVGPHSRHTPTTAYRHGGTAMKRIRHDLGPERGDAWLRRLAQRYQQSFLTRCALREELRAFAPEEADTLIGHIDRCVIEARGPACAERR